MFICSSWNAQWEIASFRRLTLKDTKITSEITFQTISTCSLTFTNERLKTSFLFNKIKLNRKLTVCQLYHSSSQMTRIYK